MDVKQAVSMAKEYLSYLFSDEGLANLRLEEVEYDDPNAAWNITLGFFRPRDDTAPMADSALFSSLKDHLGPGPRDFKVVRIDDRAAQVVSVKNRDPYQ